MQLSTCLAEMQQAFRAAGIVNPSYDAKALVQHALGFSNIQLITQSEQVLSQEQQDHLAELLAQRLKRVPLQYLLGAWQWGGISLKTDSRALIPRPETEILLQLALQAASNFGPSLRILDVGTGSGALALALKKALPQADVWASDVCQSALALAQENAANLGLSVNFVQSDLLDAISGSFELIVSNPPYLPDTDAANIQPEVTHDPPLALYAGADGLSVAVPLAAQSACQLTTMGVLLLELDPRNASQFAASLRAEGWEAQLHADLLDRQRFVWASLA